MGISPARYSSFGHFPGVRWPPADLDLRPLAAYTPITKYPRRAWNPNLYAIPVIGEFVAQTANDPKGTAYTWNNIDTLSGWPDWTKYTAAEIENELAELFSLVEYRSGVMSEALAQRTGIVKYYRGMLMFSRSSHPKTYDLAQIATTVGQFVVMHYKRKNNRPRPSQLSPSLMPPIAVPGHASFPSGHATEAYLMSGLLGKVLPGAVSTTFNVLATSGNPQPASLLDRLAERLARNREVLGLHYRSDSDAGKFLAERTLDLLVKCPTVSSLLPSAADGAQQLEWPGPE
jgi:hypothetical protein